MAITDIRGAQVDASDPPISTSPNPGLAIKAPVLVATTGSNIALSGVQVIDGVTVGNNAERVLVKDQTDQTTNGIYNAATGPWTRAVDASNNSQFATGTLVLVTAGATNAGETFRLMAANPIVLGTSVLPWVVTSTAGTVFVGDSGSGGAQGYVPAPATGQGAIDAVLKASGSFGVVGWTNVRLAKTGAYAMANSDKGKTIALGGSAFYALTFNAASGYDADFVVTVLNEDTVRAKTVTLAGGATFTLWPGQPLLVFNQNNVWQTLPHDRRWIPTTSVTFYVDVVNGSDANDGRAPGVGGAFQHIQHAIQIVCQSLDLGGVIGCTIQLANGTYVENLQLLSYIGRGGQGHTGGPMLINGNAANPALVILQPASGAAITAVENGDFEWQLQNFTINASGAQGIYADDGAWVVVGTGMIFGPAVQQVQASYGSTVEFWGNYTIASGATFHCYATTAGRVLFGNVTVTLSGTPAFTTFAIVDKGGLIECPSTAVTFTGSATGQRYSASLGGGIDTNVGGASVFPGNSSGTTTSPGWYN